MDVIRTLFTSAVTLHLLAGVSCFLFDDCEAPPQCACSQTTIQCDNRQLPRIPVFNMSTHRNMIYVKLQNNRIIVVPEKSFIGLKTDKMYIDISSNSLRDIHPQAFAEVQDKITMLMLSHNLLTSLPAAFADLSSLIYLDVLDNPMTTFDSSVLIPLGKHLRIFYVGSHEISHWPTEFSFLEALNTFHFNNISATDLPEHAFQSFSKSLRHLEIDGTKLTEVPDAICDLLKLNSLNFNNNHYLHDVDILPTCNSTLDTVSSISLSNNNLKYFPQVFSLFPRVSSISIANNSHLETMDNVTIPGNSLLTILDLEGNGFSVFPEHLGNLTLLKTLNLQRNNISEVNKGDMADLTQLTNLDLSSNPVHVIEDQAFSNDSSLYQLGLDDTELTTIPKAILNLHNLHVLNFRNNRLTCSCGSLGWMKIWDRIQTIRVTGNCENQNLKEPISTFIYQSLPNCLSNENIKYNSSLAL